MINRYSTERMQKIWSDENKFHNFLLVELAALNILAKNKIIPMNDFKKIESTLKINVKEILKLESTTKHDVIAFTRSLSKQLGDDEKKWIHYGLTSTDIVDTAYALQLKEANAYIFESLQKFTKVLKNKALKYKKTPCIGRTHGIHAEITSFGLKWLNWFDEMTRNIARFEIASDLIETGKISGAVGNHSSTSLKIQNEICEKLNINSAQISTQVLSRDHHSEYIFVLAQIANTIEKIATEIRSLQRTEILEVREFFSKEQKGSSAMPHKQNPIVSENMCGISRIVRSYVIPSLENNVLWHERDISHSSTERIIFPDITNLIDYMLTRYSDTLENLIVYEENMLKNIYLTNGVIFSQRVLTKLIEKGFSREDAYDLVQKISFQSYEENISFEKLIKENLIFTPQEIEDIFNINFFFKEVEEIYKNVL